ncbi:N-6 DNA methylase [Lutispora sp.]|uniref:type I restriction-modification system subunit M n=1 Tax=Lutispora sp. TaxID=2828727 RepID=UPI003568FCA2
MLSGELRNKVDKLWDSFWSGGISNPLTVIEQISYLLFLKRLDDMEVLAERKANRLSKKHESIFKSDKCRWSVFKHFAPQEMFDNMMTEVFPFMKEFGGKESVFGKYMKDAIFLIQKPGLLSEAVQLLDGINMEDADTKGDLYEYLLSKLSTAGVNGQFRTPRHIIKMMVELTDPTIEDKICDPACGTAGFLVAAAEHILKKVTRPESVFTDEDGVLRDKIGDMLSSEQWRYFRKDLLHGRDFDTSMLRLSSMNLILHGIDEPDIEYADSLSSTYEEKNKYTLVLANPPFKGSIDAGDINSSLKKVVDTKKTEILFLALFERILDLGGRCAAIVPDGVLFGSSTAHKNIRKMLIEENQLEGVISMPSGVFKPYAGVSTAILIFTKGGKTDKVWFYDMQADGFSLDDKRNPIEANDIPDIIESWKKCKEDREIEPVKEDKWFWVEKSRIIDNDYDLSINKYKGIEHEEVEYEQPEVIMERIVELENEILQEIKELKEMMKI